MPAAGHPPGSPFAPQPFPPDPYPADRGACPRINILGHNIAERANRGIAIGRRNWLFAGSPAGGKRAAAIYTIIETCKANGVDPHAFIADVIAKIAA